MHSNNTQNSDITADEVIRIISQTHDFELMRSFFNEIFSKAELKDLGLRWELLKKLRQEIPQRRIASELHISLCKITRGAKLINNPDSAANKILSQIST